MAAMGVGGGGEGGGDGGGDSGGDGGGGLGGGEGGGGEGGGEKEAVMVVAVTAGVEKVGAWRRRGWGWAGTAADLVAEVGGGGDGGGGDSGGGDGASTSASVILRTVTLVTFNCSEVDIPSRVSVWSLVLAD